MTVNKKENRVETRYHVFEIGKKKKDMEMRGIEPRAFHMQSERSTTELHPLHISPKFEPYSNDIRYIRSQAVIYISIL